MAKDVQSINNNDVSGGWRRVSICKQPIVMTGKQPIVMTVIIELWIVGGVEVATVKHISPWGMKLTMKNLLSAEIGKSFQHLPKLVIDEVQEPYL